MIKPEVGKTYTTSAGNKALITAFDPFVHLYLAEVEQDDGSPSYFEAFNLSGKAFATAEYLVAEWQDPHTSRGGTIAAPFGFTQPQQPETFSARHSAIKKTCTCDIHLIMREGCTCGGFAAEQARKQA